MKHFTDEKVEDAFTSIRVEFEERKNETGLDILDSYEEQWNETSLKIHREGSGAGRDRFY